MARMSDEEHEPPPLDGIVRDLIEAVPDKNLRRWRGWLRGENEMGDELRRRFDECAFDERQVEFIWKLLYNAADYQMHLLMDFIEYSTTVGRLKIQVYSAPQPSAADPDELAPPTLENEIEDGDMFPGHYLGWSEQFMQVSDDWQAEKSRDPAAPMRPRAEPPPDAVPCSFCGSADYAEQEVWQSATSASRICKDCAALATMLLKKDGEEAD
jgi:AhpD family alkylhydroperoxidase